jgi:hypothetical protein
VLGRAQEEMTEAKNYPEEHKGHDSVTVYPLLRNPSGLNQFLSTLLPALMSIAGLVLLLARVNVANLMLLRPASDGGPAHAIQPKPDRGCKVIIGKEGKISSLETRTIPRMALLTRFR